MAFIFEKLDVWNKSRNLVIDIYKMLELFPKHENYALCDQIRRAAVSIPSNIAEGSGRASKRETAHFVEIAYGSLMEVYCQLLVAWDLNYIQDTHINYIKPKVEEIAKMLSGYRKWLIDQKSAMTT